MVKRQERPEADDGGESKPRSKRRQGNPARGYSPTKDPDDLGPRKSSRRPDSEDDDLYLDLEDDDDLVDDDLEDLDADFDEDDLDDDLVVDDDDFPRLDSDDYFV